MIIDFGEYLPDLPAVGNPGLIQATNVIPYANSYKSFPSAVVYSGALSKRAQGYIGAKSLSGTVYNFCGDQSALYSLSGTSWADVTRASGGGYNTDAAEAWEFTQWGDNIVATNYADTIQSISLGGSNFAALSGSPPKAKHMAVVKDFLVLGNVTDYSSGASRPNRVHWSAFDNIALWTPSVSTQADYQDLKGDGGFIQKVIGGEYGTIIQEYAITRMTYIGSPVIFQFDQIEQDKGTPSPNSVTSVGSFVFYLGYDDFYMFTGTVSIPIAGGKVYETFLADLDPAYDYRISAVSDPTKTIVMWAYPGVGNNGGNPNKILLYNWSIKRWALITLEVEILCNIIQPGYTLEQLDNVNSNIELLNFSLDSSVWQGGALNLACFNSSHRLCQFTGTSGTATLETGDRISAKGQRTLITNIRPIVDSTSVSVQVGGRNLLSDSSAYNNSVSINSDGECPNVSEGRYNRFKVSIAGDFDYAQGLDIDDVSQGRY